jgi:hypothetical protein
MLWSESKNVVLTSSVGYDVSEVPFFEIQEMRAIATAHLVIVEALELKPSDLNGIL